MEQYFGYALVFLAGLFTHLVAEYVKPSLDKLGLHLWDRWRQRTKADSLKFYTRVAAARDDPQSEARQEVRYRLSALYAAVWTIFMGLFAVQVGAHGATVELWAVQFLVIAFSILGMASIINWTNANSQEHLLKKAS